MTASEQERPALRLSESDVRAIAERAEKATEGPWEICLDTKTEVVALDGQPGCVVIADTRFFAEATNEREVEDAALIAHARTDIPLLVSDWLALRAENERLMRVEFRLRLALDLVANYEETLHGPDAETAMRGIARYELDHANDEPESVSEPVEF